MVSAKGWLGFMHYGLKLIESKLRSDSWENAELAILTHGVVKSATLLIPPMAFNIENIGKKCFCSFFSKYVIFKFLHFFLK